MWTAAQFLTIFHLANMTIDTTQQFELLPNAPIVEAVVQVLARPSIQWDEKGVSASLKPKLSEFESSVSSNTKQQAVTLAPPDPPVVSVQDSGWHGLICQSKDRRAQFSRDGFFFSQLQPYQSWAHFFENAVRLWRVYLETARPLDMQRVGLRFINKIQLPIGETAWRKYVQSYPVPPRELELPITGFFHQETLSVPGHAYAMNIIRTVLPTPNPQTEGLGLIIDIDAYTTQLLEIEPGVLEKRLAELRWLKNMAFFGSVTPAALELFK
jgi:uncharacterized protein (TIGR04255 family)